MWWTICPVQKDLKITSMQLSCTAYCSLKSFALLSLHQSCSHKSIFASVLKMENVCVSSPAENTRAKSDVFAAENNLPNFQYVLHPRTTGFTFIVDKLRKGSSISTHTGCEMPSSRKSANVPVIFWGCWEGQKAFCV